MEYLKEIKGRTQEFICNAPQEKLRCADRKGHYEYYIGPKYLSKDQRPYAKQIAQKEYCQKLEKKIAEYETALNKLQWNFTKFLVDRNGKIAARFEPMTSMKKVKEKIQEICA